MRPGSTRATLLASLVFAACGADPANPPPMMSADAQARPDVGFFGDDAQVDPSDAGSQDGTFDDAGQPADGGPTDVGPVPDGGPMPDGGPVPDGGPMLDGGPGSDGGPMPDGGPGSDGGPMPDGGPTPDGGPMPDGGPAPDGGPGLDAGPDGGPTDTGPIDAGTLALTPTSTVVPMGQGVRFSVNAPAGATPQWAVAGAVGGGASIGTIVADPDPRTALYTAPTNSGTPPPGTFEITAAAVGETARATVDLAYVAPVITAIAPTSLDTGQTSVTATLTGSGFTAQTEIYLEGLRLAARSVRWDQLTFDIAPTLLTFPGSREVRVQNPLPGGGQDSISVTVVLRRVTIPTTVAPDVAPLFTNATIGTTPTLLPNITYPEHQSYAPRDFPAPWVSFTAATNHNVCRLEATGPAVALEIFAPTTGLGALENPAATIDTATWGLIFATNPSITLVFRVACGEVVTNGGVSQLVGGTIYESVPITYTARAHAAGGRIVYFSGLIAGLWRIELGGFNPQGTPWIGPDPAFQFQTPGCVGCHSLAPSGARMSYTSGQSEFGVFNTTAGNPSVATPLVATDGAEWSAIHPSGSWVVGVNLSAQLVLYDAQLGTVVMPVPTAVTNRTLHTQPFWSPQGDALVFVASNTPGGGVHDVFSGELWTVPFTPTAGNPTFGTPTLLVPSVNAENNFYPAYSPDGQWIVYCRAPNGATFSNSGARLRVVRANGQGGPVDLARANQGRPNNFNSWPRWAPTSQAGRYWILYSSQRPYPPLNGTGPQQLWVTQFDANLLPADPSSPGIWLPGQAPYTGNLTGEWSVSQ